MISFGMAKTIWNDPAEAAEKRTLKKDEEANQPIGDDDPYERYKDEFNIGLDDRSIKRENPFAFGKCTVETYDVAEAASYRCAPHTHTHIHAHTPKHTHPTDFNKYDEYADIPQYTHTHTHKHTRKHPDKHTLLQGSPKKIG
eukprot:GHVR01129192.1.p1 GENE.GHVR01129192.1~~GHVR01129192.1.p1  ORF type:complete len:142 (-),score=71.43 GHVR01129192.1:41-466(-)